MPHLLREIPQDRLEKGLRKLYLEQKKTLTECSIELGIGVTFLVRLLKEFNIEIRGLKAKRKKRSVLHSVALDEWRTLGISGVAKKLNLPYTRVYRHWQENLEGKIDNVVTPRSRYSKTVAGDVRSIQERFDPLPDELIPKVPPLGSGAVSKK